MRTIIFSFAIIVSSKVNSETNYSFCISEDPKSDYCLGYLDGYEAAPGVGTGMYSVVRDGGVVWTGTNGQEVFDYSSDGTVFFAPKGFKESETEEVIRVLKGIGIEPTVAVEKPMAFPQ